MSRPEIYILLERGYKPRDLRKIGYPSRTVYLYSARMPMVIMNLRIAQKKLRKEGDKK